MDEICKTIGESSHGVNNGVSVATHTVLTWLEKDSEFHDDALRLDDEEFCS